MNVPFAPPIPERDAEIKREEEKGDGRGKRYKYASFARRDEPGGVVLAEQGYDRATGANYFIIYHTKTGNAYRDIAFVNGLGETVRPIVSEEVREGHVGLPTGLEEYGTEEELDKALENHIEKWLDVPPLDRRLAVLGIRKSWVYDRFRSLNYLRALGEPGQGKSRFLDTLGLLHYKPIKVAGALTSAVLFRVIEKWRGTIILDEADLARGDETADIVKIINSGYETGTPVIRCDPNDPSKLDFFVVYCPKVISTRKPFADPATESRCLTTVMRGTNRTDIPPNLTDEFFAEVQTLRNKLLLWRFRNYERIDPDAGAEMPFEGIEPRLRQVSVGFISLFAHKTEEVERFLEYLRSYQQTIIEERAATIEGSLVKAVADLTVAEKPITAKAIIESAGLCDKHGHPWNPRAISKFMKTLGFGQALLKRVEGEPMKVYDIDKDLLVRRVRGYVPDSDLAEKIRNCVTVVTVHMRQDQTVTNDKTTDSVTVQARPNSIVTTVTQLQGTQLLDKFRALFSGRYSGHPLAVEVVQRKLPAVTDEVLREWCVRGDVVENPAGWVMPA